MEIEGGVEVDRHRRLRPQGVEGAGDEDLASGRRDGQFQRQKTRHASAPGPGAEHRARAPDLAFRGAHAEHGTGLGEEAHDLFTLHDADPEAAGGGSVALGDLVGPGEAIAGAERRPCQVIGPQPWDQRAGLHRRQLAQVVHAASPLQAHVFRELVAFQHRGEQEKIADGAEVGAGACLLLEARQQAFGFHPDAYVDLGRELGPDAACAGRRRSLADVAAVDYDDRRDAGAGQVEGQAAAHHARAHDDRFRLRRQALGHVLDR